MDSLFGTGYYNITHLCEEPQKLDSPDQQEDPKLDDDPIPRKRSRKPNSLITTEEGYDPFMLGIWKSMRESDKGLVAIDYNHPMSKDRYPTGMTRFYLFVCPLISSYFVICKIQSYFGYMCVCF